MHRDDPLGPGRDLRRAQEAEVRAAGWTVAALTPLGTTTVDELGALGRVCVMVGAEGPGLSPAALAAADLRVGVPMRAGVDSLNVSTAAAIAFHHRFAA